MALAWVTIRSSVYPFSAMRRLKSRRSSRESTRIEICWIKGGSSNDVRPVIIAISWSHASGSALKKAPPALTLVSVMPMKFA